MKIKNLLVVLSFLTTPVFLVSNVFSLELVQIKPNGKTGVVDVIGKDRVQATITTHEINIGNATDSIPVLGKRLTNCTYTRVPCSQVDNLELSINGKLVLIPRSVFADMSDLNSFMFSKSGRLFSLILKGGDASGGYTVKILFNESRVLKRQYFDAFDPNEVVQETNYYLPTPID